MRILPKLSLMAYMMCVLPLHATEYFVDKNRPDDSGDGKSQVTLPLGVVCRRQERRPHTAERYGFGSRADRLAKGAFREWR